LKFKKKQKNKKKPKKQKNKKNKKKQKNKKKCENSNISYQYKPCEENALFFKLIFIYFFIPILNSTYNDVY